MLRKKKSTLPMLYLASDLYRRCPIREVIIFFFFFFLFSRQVEAHKIKARIFSAVVYDPTLASIEEFDSDDKEWCGTNSSAGVLPLFYAKRTSKTSVVGKKNSPLLNVIYLQRKLKSIGVETLVLL